MRQPQHRQHARDGPLRRLAVDLDGRDRRRLARRLHEDLHAELQRAGVDAARERERVDPVAAEDVGDGHAQRLGEITMGVLCCRGVKGVDERAETVPGRCVGGDLGDDVGAGEGGAGDEGDGGLGEAGAREEGRHLLADFVEAGVRPSDSVHLVDGDDEARHAEGADEQGMLLGLAL